MANAGSWDDLGWLNSPEFQRTFRRLQQAASSPTMRVALANPRTNVGRQAAEASNQIARLGPDLFKQPTLSPAKLAEFRALANINVQPVIDTSAFRSMVDAANASMATSRQYESLRKSIESISRHLAGDLFSTRPEGRRNRALDEFAAAVSAVVDERRDDFARLAEDVGDGDVTPSEPASDDQVVTNFQAWLVVRLWAACVVWGWAFEDWASRQSDAIREQHGEAIADIRNLVIAGVAVAAILGLGKLGWDFLTSN